MVPPAASWRLAGVSFTAHRYPVCDFVAMISLRDLPEFCRELSPVTFVTFGAVTTLLSIVFHRRVAAGSLPVKG
jgi:hypothetical protein